MHRKTLVHQPLVSRPPPPSMGWIDIAWSMIGATSLTLGLVHLLIWARQPSRLGYLLFFMIAASVAVFSVFELRMMRAATAVEYAATLRWAHVPLLLLFASIIGFVLVHLHSGRLWLGAAVCGLRALVVALNFTTGENINFEHVAAMLPQTVWGGDSVYVPVGVVNPLFIVAQLSNLLLIAFLADASLTLWRRGDPTARRQAVILGGSLSIMALAGAVLAALLNLGLVHFPTAVSAIFLIVVLGMAYELGSDVIDAAQIGVRLRESEERLRDSEQRLQLAASAGELGLWEWNVVGDDVWMTPGCRALFGFEADEPAGLSGFLDRVHPEDRAEVERDIQIMLSKPDGDFERDLRIVLPDGRVRWVTSRGRLAGDPRGALVRLRGVSLDITARKQAEEHFRTLVEAAPSAMLVVDRGGAILLANARAEAMFGYTREELLALPIDALVPQHCRSRHETFRTTYHEAPRPRDMGAGRELFAVRRDGAQVAVEVGLSPLPNTDGGFVLASVVDVSKRKQDELDAARQRDELAHLSRVAMLGELSGSLAHELNQPLSAILSNAQAAQRYLGRDPPQLERVADILADIVSSDKRAGAVITRLRSLMKKEESQRQRIDMNEVVQEVLSLMRSDLLNRQVTVRTDLVIRLPAVLGDRVQLQQVLLNLLINGCDAMAASGMRGELLVLSEAVRGSSVCVSVADEGPGVPHGDLERIFDPFVTTKPQGMGLGLAVCRTIVKAHGGRLWASNRPGGGAILHVELPATAA